MLVRHKSDTTERLVFGGTVYEAVAPGRFDVPHEVGLALVAWPDWEIDDGAEQEEVTEGQDGNGEAEGTRKRRTRRG